jgi:hypothetical protein
MGTLVIDRHLKKVCVTLISSSWTLDSLYIVVPILWQQSIELVKPVMSVSGSLQVVVGGGAAGKSP